MYSWGYDVPSLHKTNNKDISDVIASWTVLLNGSLT